MILLSFDYSQMHFSKNHFFLKYYLIEVFVVFAEDYKNYEFY